jgi:uncharacterized protein
MMKTAFGTALAFALMALDGWSAGAPDKVAPNAQPFDIRAVKLLDGPFKRARDLDTAYLLSLDPDRLLHTFRLTAGLPTTAKPYGGWEEPNGELRGHSMGHYLTACALMYGATADERFKARVDGLVAELAKCQDALPKKGYNPGFLSAYPESFFDRVDARQSVWAPYYTLHKILAGLLDAYEQCANAQALDVLKQMAGWLQFRIGRLSDEQQQRVLGTEFGGMNEVLANLYAVTGDPAHLKLAMAFDHRAVIGPLERGEDRLDGLHANTQIPKLIGAAREYELTGEDRYRKMASFFWDRVALHRSYVIGGHSDHEHFFPIADFPKHLDNGTDTCETCNTYNMLKLTRHLFAWEPSAAAMDFYERALYNHVLASIDPRTGMFVYLMSLKPGHFKTYSTQENSFWCCVGTGMENSARFGEAIYFHGGDSLYVNLFMPSEVAWKEKGLVARQETQFPEGDTTCLALTCEKPVQLALKVRYPGWAQDGLTLKVNGSEQKVEGAPGSFITVNREWKSGDKVEVRVPMRLHVEVLPGAANTVAVLHGPIVLAGELGSEGMPNPYAHSQTELNRVPSPAVPTFACDPGQLTAHLEPVAGKASTFRTKGIGQPADVTLIPLYALHHQRYSAYWKCVGGKE